MERFDVFVARNGSTTASEPAASGSASPNGHAPEDNDISSSAPLSPPQSFSPQKRYIDNDEPSEELNRTPPPKKRRSGKDVDADAVLAAKLQAEENLRARPTRGGNSRRAAPAKRKSKSKTTKKVKAEDDSDLESGSESNKKEVNRSGGFHVSPCFERVVVPLRFSSYVDGRSL